jgi:toxin FitB
VIILDTNVVSACMRPSKHRAVVDWLNRQPLEDLWTTTITLFELRYGIEKLTADDRKAELDAAWQEFGSVIFADRILPFDGRAARAASDLAALRRKNRRSVDMRDTFIAGIALSRDATLATRNTRDFADAGVPLVDPWTARAR